LLFQKQSIQNKNVSNSSVGTPKYLKVKQKVPHFNNKTYNDAYIAQLNTKASKKIPLQSKAHPLDHSKLTDEDSTANEASTTLNLTSQMGPEFSLFDVQSPQTKYSSKHSAAKHASCKSKKNVLAVRLSTSNDMKKRMYR